MRTAERVIVTAAAGIILFCVGYGLTFFVELPLPRYFPLEHRWGVEPAAGSISQVWYGKMLFTLLFSAGPAAIADLVLSRTARPLPPRLPLIAGAAATLVAVVTLGWLMAYEFGRWGL